MNRRRYENNVLACDLDGTLVPLDDDPQNPDDLKLLKTLLNEHDVPLLFVTGRHLESAAMAIEVDGLPVPDFIISALGTQLSERADDGSFVEIPEYATHLRETLGDQTVQSLHAQMEHIPSLALQGPGAQGTFKLSYYAPADSIDSLESQVAAVLGGNDSPFTTVCSIDPNSDVGYLDVVPRGMSKQYALSWWCEFVGCSPDSIVFAGDSGNDREVFVAGYRTIVVANTKPTLAREVFEAHRNADWPDRLRFTKARGPSGVLEGCRWFEVLPHDETEPPNQLGATPLSYRRTHFRVWAGRRRNVAVEIYASDKTRRHELTRDFGGYFIGTVDDVKPSDTYRYVLDDHLIRPDPTSRRQPEDVHGPSEIVVPDNFPWSDHDWRGIPKRQLTIYELHIGTFTKEGTFRAAIDRIDYLVDLGVTAIELLPVAQSPGKWNWGYDGVGLFAVQHHYGTPDDLKALVDACHRAGIAVLLDVVYNHLGPEGNYLDEFARYFSNKHHTPWGAALDYDSRRAQPVRDFIVGNAIYWLKEYHLDGLRLDAVHFMFDDREIGILQEIRAAVSEYKVQAKREIHLIAEANLYDDKLLDGGSEADHAYDAIWCDDIMHSMYSLCVPDVKLTNREYKGEDDLAESLEFGFLFTGPKIRRVTSARRSRLLSTSKTQHLRSLVVALQTHDSVGNHPHGNRFHQLSSPATQQAVSALIWLYPAIPMLFMGEENATSAPFPFFVDFHDRGLRKAVDRGRANEYPQHAWDGAVLPSNPVAFKSANVEDAPSDHDEMFGWYQSLVRLRRDWISTGWLDAERFRVNCQSDAGVFSYSYEVSDEQSFFVVAVLHPTSSNSLMIEVDGEILLESRRPEIPTANNCRVFNTPQAIVGRGRFTIDCG